MNKGEYGSEGRRDGLGWGVYIAFLQPLPWKHALFRDRSVTRMSSTAATGSVLVILGKKNWQILHYLNAGTVISVVTHQAVGESVLCYTEGFRGSAHRAQSRTTDLVLKERGTQKTMRGIRSLRIGEQWASCAR